MLRGDISEEAMLLTFNNGAPSWIVVGTSFFNYPEESQEFMLLHEMGHHVHKHRSISVDGLDFSPEELIVIYQDERHQGGLPDELESGQRMSHIITPDNIEDI